MTDTTETLAGGVAPHVQQSGTGLKCNVYTATIAASADTITFGDFSVIKAIDVKIARSGEAVPTVISSTTTNLVTCTYATTGAVNAVVWGY